MTEEERSEYVNYLINTYPIEERYKNILMQMQDVLEALDLMKYIDINTSLLGQAIIDYFEDIDRLKKFEDIDKINVDKIYAYETFWLLRRKPIQIVDNNIGISFTHINEKVFTFILIAKMIGEIGKNSDDINPKLESFVELIYYNFKFRIFTQKSLEFVISAFFCGCSFL